MLCFWATGCLLILLSWLVFLRKASDPAPVLRVLMYHNVTEDRTDDLSVGIGQLEQQLHCLKACGCVTVSCRQVIDFHEKGLALPDNAVLITFDDGYLNQWLHALPLLRRLGMKAVFFVPTAFVGRCNGWDGGGEPLMGFGLLRTLARTEGFEVGLHSHGHQDYGKLGTETLATDIRTAIAVFRGESVPCVPVLAYPYGGYPKSKSAFLSMRRVLRESGVKMGLRIGNRPNPWPLREPLLIQRIDIKGGDSLAEFRRKTKLARGRCPIPAGQFS